jgi:hypothetical protein
MALAASLVVDALSTPRIKLDLLSQTALPLPARMSQVLESVVVTGLAVAVSFAASSAPANPPTAIIVAKLSWE